MTAPTFGNLMLDDVVRFVRRFVAMSPAQADAVAFWVLHTHALEAAEQSPYLAITSAEKRSGKSRLLDVLELIVARPWRVVTPSEAVIFRKLDAQRPTLLLDECDAIFHDKSNGATEGLRALLNAGNRPGTRVPRCVGPSQTLTDFSVFSAKALAGIRDLPDTVADRSIAIRLKRRSPDELVERFRRREVAPEGEMLRDRIADWLEPQLEALAASRPQLPDELDDRQQDCWEPLFALAELAGVAVDRARSAALTLAAVRDDDSAGVRLLGDIASIFESRDVDRISSAELVTELHEIEESPWAEWHGRPISSHGVAKLLAHHDIRPRTIRLADGKTPKGYLREQFSEAWMRYLGEISRHNATTRSGSGTAADFEPPHVAVEIALKPARQEGCGDVAVEIPELGPEAPEWERDWWRQRLAGEEPSAA